MESGFSPPRNDASFPAGLRVLVVDDDPTWLKILEKMLKKCFYEVTTCGLARDALNLLRERKDGYDIVISDVNMPDMDGFKLLEHVGLELDLPVIMMSVDGETSRVMKGVQHGACDYLLKPIRMKELRNIWQHVFRKKIHEVRDIEAFEGIESIQLGRSGSDHSDDGNLLCGEDFSLVKKRKDVESKHDERELGDSSSTKKARVVWSVDLHQRFVKAVNHVGFEKVGPKKILDLMNVPWLTRENVASHLQKYRLYLSRLQKENDLKNSIIRIEHSESTLRDSAGSFGVPSSINIHHSESSNGNYGFSGNSLLVHNVDPRSHEVDGKAILSMPLPEPKRALTVEILNSRKPMSSQMEFDHLLTSSESGLNCTAFESTFSKPHSWCEIPEIQINQEQSPLNLDDGLCQQALMGQQQCTQADYLQPAIFCSSGSPITERKIGSPVRAKPLYDEYRSNVNNASSTWSALNSLHAQPKNSGANQKVVEPILVDTSSMKIWGTDKSFSTELESAQKNMNWGISPFPILDEDLQVCWVQGDCYAMNLGLQHTEFPKCCDRGLVPEAQMHLYDTLRFDYEHLYDSTEYSLVDQALFMA